MRGRRLVRRALVTLAADEISSLKPNEVSLRVVASPLASVDGVGIVEKAGAETRFAANDLAYAALTEGLKSVANVEAAKTLKLPPNTPVEFGAFLASACTAYRLLAGTKEGDVVVHAGGEGAVGQCLAQLAALRGVHLVSLVSSDVPAQDAIDLLKNLGARVAAPAAFAQTPTFREVVADLGKPVMVVVDLCRVDVPAVASILAAVKKGYKHSKPTLTDADPIDKRDAKLITTLLETVAPPGVKFVTYGGTGATFDNAVSFRFPDWLESADQKDLDDAVDYLATAAIDGNLRVFAESYTTGTLSRAPDVIHGCYRHPFRQPLWLAD